MYYEEKFIDGKLMYRNTPEGDWHIKHNAYAKVANRVYSLSDEERMEVFSLFCTHCGSDNPRCHCWNDK